MFSTIVKILFINLDSGMKILIMRMFILGALLCLAPISFAKPIDVPQLIKARLLYMKDVALYKAKRNLAIENTDREVKMLAKAKAKANAK